MYQIHRVSKNIGIHLAPRPHAQEFVRNVQDIERKIRQFAAEKVNIIFCIVPPNKGPVDIYAKIKQESELRSCVLTQCIKSDTVDRRCNPMTLTNLLLKGNAKLNGVNHRVSPPCAPILNDFDKTPVMFVGADVTHPPPGQTTVSVAAVVASCDRNAFCYNSGWRAQIGEIIADFQTFMKDALIAFRKANGRLPAKIIYYRDGVSDSQFQQVMRSEWNDLLNACKEIEQGYEKIVKVTIIIVQKRHHTRFFPGKSGISTDKNNNVPPGTVVDTIITRPDETQYFLVSHQAIQGTARPTKYCVLLDDGEHTMDDLQTLTYAVGNHL